jgi:iron complex transport system ATP-binding protein
MGAVGLERLSASYGDTPALTDVSLTVAPGEWLGLLGPNGSGKSTLLHCAMHLHPYTGRITVGDADVSGMGRQALSRTVALVAQKPVIPAAMPVADYVLLGRTSHLSPLARETAHDLSVVRSVMERLDLGDLAGRRLGTLSGGETQRAVLARALTQEPRVILLDEPTSALDVGHQQQVFELLDELRHERKLTVIAAMHDLTLAGQYADRVALLSSGRLVACGTPPEVLTQDLIAEHYDASVTVLEGPDGNPVVVPSRRRGLSLNSGARHRSSARHRSPGQQG